MFDAAQYKHQRLGEHAHACVSNFGGTSITVATEGRSLRHVNMSQANGIATLLDSSPCAQQELHQGGHHLSVHVSDSLLEPGTNAIHDSSLAGMEFSPSAVPLSLSQMTNAEGLQSVLSISSAAAEPTVPGLDSRVAFTMTSLNSDGRMTFNPSPAPLGAACSVPQSPHDALPGGGGGGGGVSNLSAVAQEIEEVSVVHSGSLMDQAGGRGMEATDVTDLSHVLSGLQQTGELSSVLNEQPQLADGTAVHAHYSLFAPKDFVIGGHHLYTL